MTAAESNASKGHVPDGSIDPPPLYAWPPRPLKALRWLLFELLFPWGFVYIGLATLTWHFFTPDLETMARLEPGWISLVLLRNLALYTLMAGSLHWWLYMRKGQALDYKFDPRGQETDNDRFLWGNQVKDNMFWCLVSGVPIWTGYEVITYWIYASGRMPFMHVNEYPVYFVISVYAVFFWSTAHFYFNHRFLHWKPMYDLAHELHHRNVNIAPWAGISMHPVEHVIYFSVFVLWWFIPVHPIIIVLTGFFQGLAPPVSHSGFEKLSVRGGIKMNIGDYYHQLHHKYFHVNYGNIPTPLDKLFGSWHNGTREGRAVIKRRMRRYG